MKTVVVVGAGLAGCEAALQCARRGVPVRLFEMRPVKMTEAHETGDVAELVCSNSLKSDEPTNAHGLLKAELRVLGSALLECAERARVPGGKALVVDRRRFSEEVQRALERAGVKIERAEVSSLPPATGWYHSRAKLSDPHQPTVELEGRCVIPSESDESRNLSGETPRIASLPRGDNAANITVIATGPLTSQSMAESLQSLFGAAQLFFYDAIAPIVSAESLDMSRVFEGSRYGAGSDYLNCPMTEPEYDRFVAALLEAELHPLHAFEESTLGKQGTVPQSACVELGAVQPPFSPFFEGCLPVEEIARRGRLALAFGPMKPVGLADPQTGRRPFAVVQLRRENAEGTMYNLVGFQTRLKQDEQQRVFRMIPGLEKAGFLRFGSIHRNTYLDSPGILLPTLQARARPDILIAGQLTGVEGYAESIGAGLVAGINAARLARGEEPVGLPRETMLGSLLAYISASGKQGTVTGAENRGQSPGGSHTMLGGAAPIFGPPGAGQSPAVRPALSEPERNLHSLRSVGMTGESNGTRPQPRTVPVFRFQPMNANFGLLPPFEKRLRGRDKRQALAERGLAAASEFALTVAWKRA